MAAHGTAKAALNTFARFVAFEAGPLGVNVNVVAPGFVRTEASAHMPQEGLPCGPINTAKEGVELAERLGLAPVVHVGEGDDTVPSIRNPITFSSTPSSYLLPPPAPGQHTDEIRAWLMSTNPSQH